VIRDSRQGGQVTTFYSYKGGTGRTFVLANVAFLLASLGRRVCVIDWDLEAPGLHRFFRPFLEDSELEITEGLIDWLWDVSAYQLSRTESSRDRALLEYYIVSLSSPHWEFPNSGVLDFLPAGRQDSEYAKRVTSFDWNAFYDRLGGAQIIDEAREYLKATYDHVLIDSRTGVSDIAGICTIDMPDQLVACYTLNRQGIYGVAQILRTVLERRGDRRLRIFPLETRVDPSEYTKLLAARGVSRPLFNEYAYPDEYDRRGRSREDGPDGYWGDMEVLYLPFYAFEECVALFVEGRETHEEPETESKLSMLDSMCRVTSRVFLNGERVRPPAIGRGTRDRIMAQYSLGVSRSQSPPTEDSGLAKPFIEALVRYHVFAEASKGPAAAEQKLLLDREDLERLDDAGLLPVSLASDEGFMRYLLASRDAVKRQDGQLRRLVGGTSALTIAICGALIGLLPEDTIAIAAGAIGVALAAALPFVVQALQRIRVSGPRR
jgi:MinD-like ATPase involved in chromosome partitioning or flagellar assembly